MPLPDVTTLEVSTEIGSEPARVWALVGDPRRLSAFSPQLVRSFLRTGPLGGLVGGLRGGGSIQEGSRLLNLNRQGLLVWPTQSQVVRLVLERELAFRIKENRTVWSYTLAPVASGTRLTLRREAPQGISDLSLRMTDRFLGGQEVFTTTLEEGMAATLARIKAAAEQPVGV